MYAFKYRWFDNSEPNFPNTSKKAVISNRNSADNSFFYMKVNVNNAREYATRRNSCSFFAIKDIISKLFYKLMHNLTIV